MNTKLRKKTINDFEKYFFQLMNNGVFGKTIENVRKHKGIKLVTTEARRNYLVSEPTIIQQKKFPKIYQREKSKITLLRYRELYNLQETEDIYIEILKKILNQDLIIKIMNQKDLYLKKKKKIDWIDKRLNRWENDNRVCHIETKNIQLFNR